MMREKASMEKLLFQVIKVIIIFSPLEHVIGVEKIFYLTGCLVALSVALIRKVIYVDETCSLIIFVLYAATTCYWTENILPLMDLFNTAVMYFFLFLILQRSYSSQEYEQLKIAVVLQGWVLLALCFAFGTYRDNRFWIITSTTGADPNYLSGWFILPVSVATGYIIEKKNLILKILFLAEVVLALYFITESASRSGLLCNTFSIVAVVMYLLRGEMKRHPIYGIVGIIIFIVVCFIGVSMLPSYTLYRFMNASDAGSLGGRTQIWSNLISILLNKPIGLLFGMGQGSAPLYSGFNSVAHNTFLDILFENGLIGLSIYLYFFIVSLKRALKKDIVIGISMISICILIFTLSSTYMRFLIFMLFMADCHVEDEDNVLKTCTN